MLMISIDLSVELQLYAVFKSLLILFAKGSTAYIVFIKSPDNKFYASYKLSPIATISNK